MGVRVRGLWAGMDCAKCGRVEPVRVCTRLVGCGLAGRYGFSSFDGRSGDRHSQCGR